MAALPSSTSKNETQSALDGAAPVGSERVSQHDIFLTDSFDVGGVDPFEGLVDDDQYRTSKHLLSNSPPSDFDGGSREDSLRDNSLARQLAESKDQPATIRLIRRRRPDELKAIAADEPKVPWVNLIPPNTKFFLEQVNETREEKVQVIDTFGEWVAFFFGRKPEVYSYSGTLLNAKNHDWKNDFQFNYDNFLRGSQAVKHRATMILQYDSVMVEGYMLNCAITQTSVSDKSVPFQFTLLVINRSSLNPRQMLGLRFRRSGGTDEERMLFDSMQASLDLTKTGSTNDMETFILMREYFSGQYKPAAGVSTYRNGATESGESAKPGAVSGAAPGVRENVGPSFDQSEAVNAAEVEIGSYRVQPAVG